MALYIRIDIFPAQVTVNGTGVYSRVRAIVTDDAVHLYRDAAQGPEEFFVERLEDFSGDAQNGWTVITDAGDTVYIQKSSGCGCGSRLRSIRPFAGVQHLPR